MFDQRIYIQRRNFLKAHFSKDVILFPGNQLSPINYADNSYPFRQDSSFLYYFGLDKPGLTAIMDLDKDNEILFGDELSMDDEIWTGPQPSIHEQGRMVGINEVQPSANLETYIRNHLSKGGKVHFLPQYRPENLIFLEILLNTRHAQVNPAASQKLLSVVIVQRNKKSPEEIEELERAADMSVDIHLLAMRSAQEGMTEAQVAAAVQKKALDLGGSLSFNPIATVHGEVLHNHFSDQLLKKGDLFLLDAGVETAMHYAGDITRTIPVDHQFTDHQKAIYRIVHDAHDTAAEALMPGVSYLDIHTSACRTIAGGLKEVGLMMGNVDEAVAHGAHALFFPHGIGHMMGLDVHDMENLGEDRVGYGDLKRSTQFGLKSLRLARNLESGFVVTVEPGIYFIPGLIRRWKGENKFSQFINYDLLEKYMEFGGIRIEDDYVITEKGAKKLGKPLPASFQEIENIRKGCE